MSFHDVITHVMGSAFDAAHYHLENAPLQQQRGLYRYVKHHDHGYCFIEFQSLYHDQSELTRMRVNLIKSPLQAARQAHPDREAYTLPYVIWHLYGAEGVLPTEEYWWVYKDDHDLAYQLVDAGKLLFAYGVPWLEDTMDVEA